MLMDAHFQKFTLMSEVCLLKHQHSKQLFQMMKMFNFLVVKLTLFQMKLLCKKHNLNFYVLVKIKRQARNLLSLILNPNLITDKLL